jgi:4-hydroxybutyrate CoA-transferase
MDWTSAEAAFADVPPGARLVAGNCCGTPETLLRALGAHAERTGGGQVLYAGLLLGDWPFAPAIRSGALTLRCWHVYGPGRRLWRDGFVEYLPLRLPDVARTVLGEIDVALVRVGPPDADGWCSLGPSASFAADAVAAARLVIAEVADEVPRTHGDARVHVSRIDRFVRAEGPAPAYTPPAHDPVSVEVARRVAGIIPPESTVQLGIGAITEALAPLLAETARAASLRVLGMVSESMIPLVDAVTEAGHGPVQAVELLGGPALMAYADGNPAIEMRSSRVLHDPVWLSRTPRLVSINSAIAVDLSGQVVAETAGGSVLAGVGGSADFFEGAHLSPGGFRVIALRSTTRRGDSTIVAEHGRDDLISIPHHSVDAVVTEHGVAWLRGRTRRERRAALAEIAAPEHREKLRARAGTGS